MINKIRNGILLTVLLGSAVVLVGCGSQVVGASATSQPVQSASTTPQTNSSSSSIASGKAIYNANCADCHGIDGVGGSASPLNNGEKTQDLIEITKNGMNPVMPGFKDKLNDNQIKDVANYVSSLKK